MNENYINYEGYIEPIEYNDDTPIPVYKGGYFNKTLFKESTKEKYDRYQAYLKEQEERLAQQNEDFQL